MTTAAAEVPAATGRAKARVGRVVIATINREEGDTGVHTHTRMLAGGMRDAGVACDIISPFGGSKKWLPIFAVRPLVLHRVNRTWSTLWHRKFHLAALRENLMRQLAGDATPDAVIAQCPVSAKAAIDVRDLLRAKFPIAMVCHFNGSEATEYRDKGELASSRHYQAMLDFEQNVLESVDRVIYVSNWARENVEAVRGIRTKSSAVIWNGMSDEAAASSAIKRVNIGVRDDDLVIMNVGSLEPRKNQLGLIDLFAVVRDHFDKAKLVLVGDGPARDEIGQKIDEKHLADSVRLLGHRRDVSSLLPLADLYVHYANLENCPLVLIEAARAALPIAAVPTGGVPELLDALDCKFEINPADGRGTLERLRPLLQDAATRKDTGMRAQEAYRRTFTAAAMTRAYIDALTF